MRGRDNRMARLRHTIEGSPVRRPILEEAYAWFREFGDLPDDQHVAFEVVERALRGGDEDPPDDETRITNRMRAAELAYRRGERAAMPPTVRGLLFDEALFAAPPMRALARALIAVEVAYGGDVESAGFGARHGIPVHGSVAMHIAGYPKKWVTPPYEHQATQLLVRLDNIRQRVPYRDDSWFEAQAKAIAAFQTTGELPKDDLHFEAVLANVELDQLIAHGKGKDVAEAMALFREVAWGEGTEQAEALRKLCDLAKAGQLA